LSHFIAIVLVFFCAFGVLFFSMTSIIALTYPHSPFRTPSTAVCEYAFQFLSQKYPLVSQLKNSLAGPHWPLLDPLSRATINNHVLNAQAMTWIMVNHVDETAIQSASLSVITLPSEYALAGVLSLHDDVPGAIICLLTVADFTARYSAEAKLTHNDAATDVVSVTLRALYHGLYPIVLNARYWDDLKRNEAFQTHVTWHLRALKSLNLNSEKLRVIVMSDASFKLHSSSLETLVQHVALLVYVHRADIRDPDSPSYGIFFELDQILWTYAHSSSCPPITVLNSIVIAMIHGNKDMPRDVSDRVWFSEEMFIVSSHSILQLVPNLYLSLGIPYAKIYSFSFRVRWYLHATLLVLRSIASVILSRC
jgi:hypothetical protein